MNKRYKQYKKNLIRKLHFKMKNKNKKYNKLKNRFNKKQSKL